MLQVHIYYQTPYRPYPLKNFSSDTSRLNIFTVAVCVSSNKTVKILRSREVSSGATGVEHQLCILLYWGHHIHRLTHKRTLPHY